jgi:hypothetical protein
VGLPSAAPVAINAAVAVAISTFLIMTVLLQVAAPSHPGKFRRLHNT